MQKIERQNRAWAVTARTELNAFKAKYGNQTIDVGILPLCESLRKIHEYVSSLSIKFSSIKDNTLIRVSEQMADKPKALDFETFLGFIYDIKTGTEFTQYVPDMLHSMIECLEKDPIRVSLGNNTIETFENLLNALREWRTQAHFLTEKTGPMLKQLILLSPDISRRDSGNGAPMHERIKFVKAVIDAHTAYSLIKIVAGKLNEEELARVMHGNVGNARIYEIEKRRKDIENRIMKLNSETTAISTTLSLVEDEIIGIKQSKKQEEKSRLKDYYRTRGTLIAKLGQLTEAIQDATGERTLLLREYVAFVFPNSRSELSANSEIPKPSEEFASAPAVEMTGAAEEKPREKTPREVNDFMLTYLPRLYGMLISKPSDETRRQRKEEIERQNRNKKLRTLERVLVKAGVPQRFISENVHAGETNPEAIISGYKERLAVPESSKVAGNVFRFEKPVQRPQKIQEAPEQLNERVLRHFVNQLIRAKSGKSLDELKNGEKELIERSLAEITAFLRAYVNYLKQPKGVRGKFEKGSDSVTSFKPKTWTDVAKPYEWVAFGLQAGGEARIVFCIRPEHNEIALLMAEQRHEAYSLALRLFDGAKDIRNCVVIRIENEKLIFSVAQPKSVRAG